METGIPSRFIFMWRKQTMKRSWLSTIDYRLAALIAAILLLGLTTGCAVETIADRQDEDVLIRLSDAEIRGLDPQKVSDLAAIRVARDQFEGLTRFDGKGEAEPGLAKSWTVSTDGKVWTFTLRDNLKFSDGHPIIAQTFASIWERLQAEATASPHKALFAPIMAISAQGDATVQVILRNPYPELPALLAHPAMAALPMHRIAQLGDQWTGERPLVTSGAYRTTQWILNDRLVLQANPHWHQDAADIAEIQWKPADDALNGMRQVLGGAADIASDYPSNRHQWLMENHAEFVHVSDYLGTYYFAFNSRTAPFDNANIRRALSMAVDRTFLTEELIGLGNNPAHLVVPQRLWRFQNTQNHNDDNQASHIADRRKQARQLLEDAGYNNQEPLRFDIRINSSREHKRVAVALAAMWSELPVEASVLNSEASLHFAGLRRGDFALARSGWIADLPTPENFLAVHSTNAGPSNYSGYNNPDYDALLAKAADLADPMMREKALYDAALLLAEDAPILPLYYYTARNLVSPRITGWQDNVLNIHPSSTLSFTTQ